MHLSLLRTGLPQVPNPEAPLGKVGVTDDGWDSGRPTSEPWERFPVMAVLEVSILQRGHPGMD